MKRTSSDTLEAIVQEAIEREKRINKEHPERHGYGMIQGEADDLIKRIRLLEGREELAQRTKGGRINQRIRLTNSDRVYSRSPEEVAIHNLYKQKVNKAERKFFDDLSARSKEIYNRREQGDKFTDIGKVVGLHISNVSRNYYKSLSELREELKKTLGKEIYYNGC